MAPDYNFTGLVKPVLVPSKSWFKRYLSTVGGWISKSWHWVLDLSWWFLGPICAVVGLIVAVLLFKLIYLFYVCCRKRREVHLKNKHRKMAIAVHQVQKQHMEKRKVRPPPGYYNNNNVSNRKKDPYMI